jgi:hypothetical protein
MNINYWHIQLNPNDRLDIDKIKLILTTKQVIGMGESWNDKNGNPVKGIASALHPVVDTVEAVSAMGSAANGGGVCISVTSDASVAALKAAHGLGLRARALMSNELCMDPYAVQLIAANLGDAGIKARLASRLVIHKLVDMQIGHQRAAEAVEGVAAALPALHLLGVLKPEVFG